MRKEGVIPAGEGTAEHPSGYVVNEALCDAVLGGQWNTLMLDELARWAKKRLAEMEEHRE
jgi:hypothetical protein